MQFVKTIVDSIGYAGGDANVDSIIENMDQYHARIWKQFILMPIEKLPKSNESPPKGSHQLGGGLFSSPKSLLLPSISSKSPLNRSPLSLSKYGSLFCKQNFEKAYEPSSHQENVSFALYDTKCKLYQLEQCVLSSAYPTDPNYEEGVNLDKVSVLLDKADKLVAELSEELVKKHPNVVATKEKLDSILQTLQTTSTSIERATEAFKSLSKLLSDHLTECINLVDADVLLLTLAKQLRLYWLVHFLNHQKGPNSIFESQLDQFIEALFTALIDACQINSKSDFPSMASNVSLDVFTTLLESLLPYLAIVDGHTELSVNSVMRSKNLIHILETGLIQYSLISSNINGFPQVRVTVALLRLLNKYSLQAVNKPATDLPPFDFPAIYANALGKILTSAQSLLTSKLFLNHAAIFLLEISELFEVYSDFKVHDNPLGLDCVKRFLDSLLFSLGDSIWNYMGPLEHKLHSKKIEPSSVELLKYISQKYPKKNEKKEKDEPSTVDISENPMPSTSTSVVPLTPPPAESPLTTRIEEVHSSTDEEQKDESMEDDVVPIEDLQSTPLKRSLSFSTSISWLKSLKSTLRRRISRSEEESENKKRKLCVPEVIDIDDSGPDFELVSTPKRSDSSESRGASTSPNKKQKSGDNCVSKSESQKTLVIDLEEEQPQPTSPPSLASSAAEAVRQSSKLASSPSKSPASSESSDDIRKQVLQLQSELSQMSNQFNRLMEKLNR